ncbi:hypothetical protein NGM37_50205, partial [Streptomyces sp. TRM76130]|nr:hypothetical protein [Streptomyces sp. TRM76130]
MVPVKRAPAAPATVSPVQRAAVPTAPLVLPRTGGPLPFTAPEPSPIPAIPAIPATGSAPAGPATPAAPAPAPAVQRLAADDTATPVLLRASGPAPAASALPVASLSPPRTAPAQPLPRRATPGGEGPAV